jgi:very-short-patch-repair endonuclease
MTQSDYKEKYGMIISESTKNLFSDNLSKIEMPPQSKSEKEIYEFISSIYDGNIVTNTKQVIGPFEIDIYLPDLKFAIEVNGLYFHSEISGGRDKHYHLAKTTKANKLGIRLLHIFEDEWKNKTDIIKSMLLSRIGGIKTNLNARSMAISAPTSSEKNDFLKRNHLQGQDKSSIFMGLYSEGELVSLMTFGSLRSVLGSKSVKNQYELIRFCNKLNVSCRGSFSKLLSHFIRNKNPDKVVTYADCRFSVKSSNVYEKNGFGYISTSKPNYFYMKNHDVRLHRFNFPKHKLVKLGHDSSLSEWDIMKSINYDRIWDCGHFKYEWNKTCL